MNEKKYLLLDSGDGKKLEKVGPFLLIRPSATAIWNPSLSQKYWDEADAEFSRKGENKWYFKKKIPSSWILETEKLKFKVVPTDFGHLGVFPEHFVFFDYIEKKFEKKSNPTLLNLFAYTGGISLAAAKAGAKVCHLDASNKAVFWARENAALNNLEKAPIRYIIDDVTKFLKREINRKVKYDAIVLDPPSFGRGSSGQVFKIEKELFNILDLCLKVLSDHPSFIILTCHTPGMTPKVLQNIFYQAIENCEFANKFLKKDFKNFTSGEMILTSESSFSVPSGSYIIWEGQSSESRNNKANEIKSVQSCFEK